MGELKYPTALIVEALLVHRGLIAAAARQIGCTEETIRKRARRSPAVRQAITDGRERLLDLSEERMVEAIKRDEPWAISLVLKTLGKNRGYVERQETVNKAEAVEVVTRVVRVAADG